MIRAADDEVFHQFCKDVKISNIRAYEDRELKLQQEQEETRLRFEKQLTRLQNQYANWSTQDFFTESKSGWT